MTYSKFKSRIADVELAISKTRTASYTDFKISKDKLIFKRVNTKTLWHLELTELYQAYSGLDYITPTILRNVMTGRIYSPAWAILVAAGFYDRQGNKIKGSR